MAARRTEDEAAEGADEISAIPKTVSSSAATSTQPKIHCYFLDLPTELRLYIYEILLLSLHKPVNDSVDVYHLLNDSYYRSEGASATAVLYANKQIFFEAWPALNHYRNALISFMLYVVNRADKELNDDKQYNQEIG